MSFGWSVGIGEMAELTAEELQLLADSSLRLADRYERNAPFMEDEEGRQIALALSRWRRDRGRRFRELSAEAERIETAQIERVRQFRFASG